MREGRSANDDLIVIEDQFVQSDLYRLPQQPAGDLSDLAFGDFAELDQLAWLVPTVVEDVDSRKPSRPLFGRDPYVAVDRLLAHRLVRAERNQKFQGLDSVVQRFVYGSEPQRKRRGPRRVLDEGQPAPPVESGAG